MGGFNVQGLGPLLQLMPGGSGLQLPGIYGAIPGGAPQQPGFVGPDLTGTQGNYEQRFSLGPGGPTASQGYAMFQTPWGGQQAVMQGNLAALQAAASGANGNYQNLWSLLDQDTLGQILPQATGGPPVPGGLKAGIGAAPAGPAQMNPMATLAGMGGPEKQATGFMKPPEMGGLFDDPLGLKKGGFI